MSKLIKKQTHFLHMLMSTSTEQRKALLYTVTDIQIKCISEIALNLLQLKLNKRIKVVIKKYKKLLTKLASKSLSNKKKSELIIKSMRVVLNIFEVIAPNLKKLI